MKKSLKILGWIFVGVFLQFKFNVLYGIVFLENLNFHDRAYQVKINFTPAKETIGALHVESIVHHSLGADYFATVYIPDQYDILNQKPYVSAEPLPGYRAYQMNMKRKYRDVLSAKDFLVSPLKTTDIPPMPIIVKFENMTQHLHTDKTYVLSTENKVIRLKGPAIAEATFPQQWGM
ncbi:MAG: hypothetical protein ACE5G9_00590 [Nitrospinales bacterium]